MRKTILSLLVVAAMFGFAACSSSKKNTSGGGGSSQTTVKAATAPSGPASPTTIKLATQSGGHYTVTVTPKAPDPKAACAQGGGLVVPFTVDIKNEDAKQADEPYLGFVVDSGGQKGPVVAIDVQNNCIDFTLQKTTMDASSTHTYQGSLSGATANTKMILNLLDNNGQSTQSVPLFAS